MESHIPPNSNIFLEKTRVAFRIDYALMSAHLYHQVTNSEYSQPPVKTDHQTFEIHLKLDKFKSGRGYIPQSQK